LIEPGGVVNVVTKQPQDTTQYAVEQQIGSLGDYRTTLAATGPLTQPGDLLYRVDMSYEDNAAPFGSKIDLTHSQNSFIAPVLKWDVDGSTWLKIDLEYDQSKSDYFLPFVATYNNTFLTVPRNVNYSEPSPWNQNTILADVSGSHDFGNRWSIKGRLAFQNLTNYANYTWPIDLLPGPPVQVQQYSSTVHPDQKTFSAELDLTGHVSLLGVDHNILLGSDFYRINSNSYGDTYSMTVIDYFHPVYTGFPPAQNCLYCGPFAWRNDQDTFGIYAQDQVTLPYDFHFLAGVRFQYIRQDRLDGASLGDLTPQQGGTLYAHAFTPRAGLLWHPEKWVSFYGNYTEGFAANSGEIYPGTLAPPTSARSWEIGAKIEAFDGRLRISADYFDLSKTNITTPDPNPLHDCGYGPGSCSILIGQVRSNGPELDIAGDILPGWSVTANYSHDDIRPTVENGGYPAIGQQFPNVPRDTANFWTTYEITTGTLKGLKVGGGAHYTGPTPIWDYADPVGTFAPLPSYATVDVMVGYDFELAGKAVTTQLNITNLFDKTYYVAASFDGDLPVAQAVNVLQYGIRSYGAPFSALGSIKVEF